MRMGAHDYLLKGKLARLSPAIERELREREGRRARAQAENALQKSEERYRTIFESNPLPLWVLDAQTSRFSRSMQPRSGNMAMSATNLPR
jgi:PAS domain-containing protein